MKIEKSVQKQLKRIAKSSTPEIRETAYGLLYKAGNPDALINWFNEGADGQIDWGSENDFDTCVSIASEHMDEDQAKGFCNLRHQDATGAAPGQASGEKND